MQLLNAQSELSIQVLELRRSGGSDGLTAAEVQLSELSQVQQRLASGTVSVAALRSEVTAIVAAATAVAAATRTSTASHGQHADAALQMASTEARRTVNAFVTDFYEKKIFDPYLRFTSAEDEAAYRERVEERQRAIEAAKAENSPDGNLRALSIARDQLRDAGIHGATDSPQFAAYADRIDSQQAHLANAIGRAEPARAASEKPPVDPLDDIAPSSVVDRAALASLRAAGVILADQTQQGHGVTRTDIAATEVGRT